MHNGENFLFPVYIGGLIFLPVDENGFDAAAWLCLEHERLIGMSFILYPAGDFVDVFLLSGEELFVCIVLHGAFAGTGDKQISYSI